MGEIGERLIIIETKALRIVGECDRRHARAGGRDRGRRDASTFPPFD